MEDRSSLAESILEQIADAVIYADETGTIRRWNHAIVDVKEEKMKAVADEVRAGGRRATTFKADVTKRDDVFAAVDHAEKELSGFDIISLDDWRIVAANLSGGNRSTTDRLVPYTLFIDPELGRVGTTEAEARRRGLRVRVARLPAEKIPRAMTSGETRGYLKAVVDADTNQVLGASILAAHGDEVMSVIQVAMRAGLPYTALRDMVFAHPTMVEGLNDLFKRLE